MPPPIGSTQKAEFCRNWIESAKCRFEDKCRFAHAQEELTPMAVLMYGDKFKTNNCRTFYKTSMCNFGSKCMFRHEHRYIVQLHRHYYTPHLYVYESLFASSMDQARFIRNYQTKIARLPVFEQIHAQFDPSDDEGNSTDEATESDAPEFCEFMSKSEEEYIFKLRSEETGDSVGSASPIAKSRDNSLSRSGSSLNTTHDESTNEESLCKLERSIRLSQQKTLDSSDEEIGQESENLDVSLSSIGLDFV